MNLPEINHFLVVLCSMRRNCPTFRAEAAALLRELSEPETSIEDLVQAVVLKPQPGLEALLVNLTKGMK